MLDSCVGLGVACRLGPVACMAKHGDAADASRGLHADWCRLHAWPRTGTPCRGLPACMHAEDGAGAWMWSTLDS
jgi:hypothetical protein